MTSPPELFGCRRNGDAPWTNSWHGPAGVATLDLTILDLTILDLKPFTAGLACAAT